MTDKKAKGGSDSLRELVSCPFCGNETLIVMDDGNNNWRVDCTLYDQIGCGTEGPAAWSEKEAVDKWNKRAASDNAEPRETGE